MCMKASAQLMPAQPVGQEAGQRQHDVDRPQAARAVSAMRGVSFWSFIGPAISALKSWLPPTPSSGRIATASTMMPRPPIQLQEAAPDVDRQRQRVEPAQHRGAGGGEARHRLEVGVGDAQARQRQQQRQRAERRQHDPGQRRPAGSRRAAAARAGSAASAALISQRRRRAVDAASRRRRRARRRRRRTSAKASGTQHQQREQHDQAADQRDDGERTRIAARSEERGADLEQLLHLAHHALARHEDDRRGRRSRSPCRGAAMMHLGCVVGSLPSLRAGRARWRRSARPRGRPSSSMRRPTTLAGLAVAARHRLQRLGRAAAQAVHRLRRRRAARRPAARRSRSAPATARCRSACPAPGRRRPRRLISASTRRAPRRLASRQAMMLSSSSLVSARNRSMSLRRSRRPSRSSSVLSPCSTSTSAGSCGGQVLAALRRWPR